MPAIKGAWPAPPLEIFNMGTVKPLFDDKQIAERVDQLAGSIASTISGNFIIVGLLKGSFMLVADLARALDRHGLSPQIEFMQVSSYGNSRKSSGEVRVNGKTPASIAGNQILLIDDIVDPGHTLHHTSKLLLDLGAQKVWTCCLLEKPSRREIDCNADFIGFEVEDVFVVGYGIDYAEKYRYLPYIGVVD